MRNKPQKQTQSTSKSQSSKSQASKPEAKRRGETVEGRISITQKGFGFVLLEGRPDVFVAYEHLGTAMDGDHVRAELFPRTSKKKPAGRVVEVLERSDTPIIGVFRRNDGGGVVFPEDERLPRSLIIPNSAIREFTAGRGAGGRRRDLDNGKIVVARLTSWSDPTKKPEGRIEQVVGDQDEQGMDVKLVALSKGLELEFSSDVTEEVRQIPEPNFRREVKRRSDLRSITCFTIDPESAQDFDDALSLVQLPNGLFELGVHIADVTHFVREGSALDSEAWKRGTSVYFVRTALPMLPERLSNELCSLKPGEERLAYSVRVQLDSLGNIHGHRIEESVIRSRRRYTYRDVEDVIHGKKDKHADTIHLMQMMSQVLRKRREQQGSIDFDLTEKRITLDEEGIPRMVQPAQRLEANRLVEEFMLLANRVVASHVIAESEHRKTSLPFLFRVHETPREEDAQAFLGVIENLGIPYRVGETIEPEDYRNILAIIQNLDFKDFVEKIALYSMTKAIYSTENVGHFGLGFDAYTHFTSPIRRYPDLVVHRLLKRYARRQKPGRTKPLQSFLERTAEHANEMEKRATDAEREYTKLKSMEFLARRVGNLYEGVISGVTSFGLFVELTRYLIEGLVPLSALSDDRYTFDAENYRYVGEETGRIYRLGDRVQVRITNVSVEDRKADFEMV
ncbi:MAG: ribonuclease R [Spirochaetaceae bacterium]